MHGLFLLVTLVEENHNIGDMTINIPNIRLNSMVL